MCCIANLPSTTSPNIRKEALLIFKEIFLVLFKATTIFTVLSNL